MDNIGISREICAYKNSENEIISEEFKGQNLKQVINEHHDDLIGESKDTQLVRVAYIDANEDLSLQVHPDDKYARKYLNDFGKPESWYILDCSKDAYVTAGTTITDKSVLKRAAENGILEQYIQKIEVQTGDFIMIPAGLLHACGRNMLAIEIGGFGGITYRLYDYKRGRKLDIDKGFKILNPSLKCKHVRCPIKYPDTGYEYHTIFECSEFCVDVVDIKDIYIEQKGNYYVILTCVNGTAELTCQGENTAIPFSESILIPACIDTFEIKGQCRILKSFKK